MILVLHRAECLTSPYDKPDSQVLGFRVIGFRVLGFRVEGELALPAEAFSVFRVACSGGNRLVLKVDVP